MEPHERERCLSALADLPSDADLAADPLRVFLPLREHARVLHERVIVVRGDRGAGKTALFLFLRAAQAKRLDLATLFNDARVPAATWIEGFSENGAQHPMVDVLTTFGEARSDAVLRAFWLGYLAGVLADHGELNLPDPFREAWHRKDPSSWIDAARLSIGPLSAALDDLDQRLERDDRRVFVSYDHLDRIPLPEQRRFRYASILVDFWLSLSNRYRRLRAKIFLREDIYTRVRSDWPDASKVEARSVSLRWDAPQLFRLLVRHMSANDDLRRWLLDHPRVEVVEREGLGWFTRSDFADESERERLMSQIAGSHMGAGPTKGATHRWLTSKTRDANQQVHPRSVLQVLAGAAQAELRQPRAPENQLLHHISLTQGLQRASASRIAELKEEFPEVAQLEKLRGVQLLLDKPEVLEKLGGEAPERTYDRLVEIGVLVEEDGRVNVPDLYRFTFDMKRKGGSKLN